MGIVIVPTLQIRWGNSVSHEKGLEQNLLWNKCPMRFVGHFADFVTPSGLVRHRLGSWWAEKTGGGETALPLPYLRHFRPALTGSCGRGSGSWAPGAWDPVWGVFSPTGRPWNPKLPLPSASLPCSPGAEPQQTHLGCAGELWGTPAPLPGAPSHSAWFLLAWWRPRHLLSPPLWWGSHGWWRGASGLRAGGRKRGEILRGLWASDKLASSPHVSLCWRLPVPPALSCVRLCVCAYGVRASTRFLFVGAAAARGQVGKRDSGSSTEHHREVHLPPQVQEGKLTNQQVSLQSWGVGGEGWSSWSWHSWTSRGSSAGLLPSQGLLPCLCRCGQEGWWQVSHLEGSWVQVCVLVDLWVWVGVQADKCLYLNVEGQRSTSTER